MSIILLLYTYIARTCSFFLLSFLRFFFYYYYSYTAMAVSTRGAHDPCMLLEQYRARPAYIILLWLLIYYRTRIGVKPTYMAI